MAKTYWITPGDSSVNPSTYTGLSPTMIIFVDNAGNNVTAPGITESPAGSGVYRFNYYATLGMFITIDWGGVISSSFRYTKGSLDPIQAVDEHIGGILNNNDSIGTTSVDPSSVIGYLKRIQELLEGDASFQKSTGTWSIYSRGSSTLLREKDLSNSVTEATKT